MIDEQADERRFYTLKAMEQYGGGFASALAVAAQRADPTNMARLVAAFPDLFENYGPASAFYRAAKEAA